MKNQNKLLNYFLLRLFPIICLWCMSANVATAQVTRLTNGGTMAEIDIYLRFTDMAQIRDITLSYFVNGSKHTLNTYTTVTKCKKQYYKFTLTNLPWDATNKCLLYPIVIQDNTYGFFNNKGLSWREGMISSRKENHNRATLWGESYLFIQQYFPGLTELTRYDYITIDDDMEETMMYEYDMTTGVSTPLDLSEQGICTWEKSNQEFQHVTNKDYDMSEYPYRAEVVLARKSAYKSYQYNNPNLGLTYGSDPAAGLGFGTDAHLRGDDVFHACADGGTLADVTFKTLRCVDESKWPTGCSANRSVIMQSYNTAEGDFDGLVGHLRLIFTPKTRKWKAETWVEMTNNNPDGWGTFSTPYDVKVPSGLLVIIIDGLVTGEADRLNMVSMADHPNIPANTGVIVKGTGTFRFLPADPSTIVTDRTAYAGSNNKMQYVCFKPNLATSSSPYYDINHLPYLCSGGTHYVLTYDATNKVAKFVEATKNTPEGNGWDDDDTYGHIPPFKSYLCFDFSSSPVKELFPVMPGESDIVRTPAQTSTADPKGIYDLTGRRYDNLRNLPRGIYIVNGRKVAF